MAQYPPSISHLLPPSAIPKTARVTTVLLGNFMLKSSVEPKKSISLEHTPFRVKMTDSQEAVRIMEELRDVTQFRPGVTSRVSLVPRRVGS